MIAPDPRLARSLVRWQRAAGPYWPYVCAAPFLGDIPIRLARPGRLGLAPTLVGVLANLGQDERPAVFLDLPPASTLPATPHLNQLGLVVVPVIQRWIAAPAVLPCAKLLVRLIAAGQQVRYPSEPRGVVFLLDGERAEAGSRTARHGPRRAFDNRYSYRLDRFPSPDFLARHGITTIRWLAPAGIASDLLPYTRQLGEAGFTLEVQSVALPVASRRRPGHAPSS